MERLSSFYFVWAGRLQVCLVLIVALVGSSAAEPDERRDSSDYNTTVAFPGKIEQIVISGSASRAKTNS